MRLISFIKTPFRADVLEAIAKLNDQLCYYTFVDAEFGKQLKQLRSEDADYYTTDVFNDNAKAHRIHVRISELPHFRRVTADSAFGALFTTSYEMAAGYFTAILEFLKRNDPAFRMQETEAQEDTYMQSLSGAGYGLPDGQVIDTLGYCRLRRNHFVHCCKQPTSGFARIIRQKGTLLNRYWPDRAALDFALTPQQRFDEAETIDLIKIMRVAVKQLDDAFAASLEPEFILVILRNELIERDPSLQRPENLHRLARKLTTMGIQLYGADWRQKDVELLLE